MDIQDVIKHLEIKKKDIELCIGLIKQGNQFIPRQSSPLLEAISVAIETLKAKADGRLVVLPRDGQLYYIEEAGGEKWVGNKPIRDIVLKCGHGLALIPYSIQGIGKTVFLNREEADQALREQAIDTRYCPRCQIECYSDYCPICGKQSRD